MKHLTNPLWLIALPTCISLLKFIFGIKNKRSYTILLVSLFLCTNLRAQQIVNIKNVIEDVQDDSTSVQDAKDIIAENLDDAISLRKTYISFAKNDPPKHYAPGEEDEIFKKLKFETTSITREDMNPKVFEMDYMGPSARIQPIVSQYDVPAGCEIEFRLDKAYLADGSTKDWDWEFELNEMLKTDDYRWIDSILVDIKVRYPIGIKATELSELKKTATFADGKIRIEQLQDNTVMVVMDKKVRARFVDIEVLNNNGLSLHKDMTSWQLHPIEKTTDEANDAVEGLTAIVDKFDKFTTKEGLVAALEMLDKKIRYHNSNEYAIFAQFTGNIAKVKIHLAQEYIGKTFTYCLPNEKPKANFIDYFIDSEIKEVLDLNTGITKFSVDSEYKILNLSTGESYPCHPDLHIEKRYNDYFYYGQKDPNKETCLLWLDLSSKTVKEVECTSWKTLFGTSILIERKDKWMVMDRLGNVSNYGNVEQKYKPDNDFSSRTNWSSLEKYILNIKTRDLYPIPEGLIIKKRYNDYFYEATKNGDKKPYLIRFDETAKEAVTVTYTFREILSDRAILVERDGQFYKIDKAGSVTLVDALQ